MTAKEKLFLLMDEMNLDQLEYLLRALTSLQSDRELQEEMQCQIPNSYQSFKYLRFNICIFIACPNNLNNILVKWFWRVRKPHKV